MVRSPPHTPLNRQNTHTHTHVPSSKHRIVSSFTAPGNVDSACASAGYAFAGVDAADISGLTNLAATCGLDQILPTTAALQPPPAASSTGRRSTASWPSFLTSLTSYFLVCIALIIFLRVGREIAGCRLPGQPNPLLKMNLCTANFPISVN